MKTFTVTFTGRYDEANKPLGPALLARAKDATAALGKTEGVELKSARLVTESGGAHHNEGSSQSVDLLAPAEVPGPVAEPAKPAEPAKVPEPAKEPAKRPHLGS